MGAAQDMQIIRSLFENTMKAADIIGGDENFRKEIEKKLRQTGTNENQSPNRSVTGME